MSDADDYIAIQDLASSLFYAMDGKDYAAIESCFTPDAVYEVVLENGPPPMEGRDTIVAGLRHGLSPFDLTQHLIGTPRIRINGDRAQATFCVYGQHVVNDHPKGDTCLVGGVIVSELVRTDDGWRISRQQPNVTWIMGNGALLEGA